MNIILDTIPYIHYILSLNYSKVVRVVMENSLKSKQAGEPTTITIPPLLRNHRNGQI